MDTLEVLLAPEVLAGVLIVGALAIAVRSLLHFSKEASQLRPKLDNVDRQLKQLRETIAPKKQQIGELSTVVAPIKLEEQKFSTYYNQLKDIEINAEKEALKKQDEEEAAQRRRVQRKKMGFTTND